MYKNKKYKSIEDIDKFVLDISLKYGIKNREKKSILKYLEQERLNGELLYEENYNNEDKVRVFNKHNIELWEYIEKNSVTSFDGTAKTELLIKDLLKEFNYPDTKEYRCDLLKEINVFGNMRNIIIDGSSLRTKAWIDTLFFDEKERVVIMLPYSQERQIKYLKNNPVIGG